MRFLLPFLFLFPTLAQAGQTFADTLITRLTGVPVTAFFDIDARLDLLEASVPAGEVTYTPADTNDWPGADPTLASGALDTLAERATALEAAAAKGRLTTVTVGAEAADAIAVTIEVDDLLGVDATGPVRLQVRLWTDQHFTTAVNAAAFPISDGGDGTIEASDLGVVSAIVLTGAGAGVQLVITDAAGASGSTVYGTVEVLGAGPIFSAVSRFVATFDGV